MLQIKCIIMKLLMKINGKDVNFVNMIKIIKFINN